MINRLFTDNVFLQLESKVQLVVIHFSSIGISDIDYNQLEKNHLIIDSIYKLSPCSELEFLRISIHNDIIKDLTKNKFKFKKYQLKFTPPSASEALDYIVENIIKLKDAKSISDIKSDITNFNNYYESVNWVVGKKKQMTNWKTALVRWLNSDFNKSKKTSQMSESMMAYMKLNQ